MRRLALLPMALTLAAAPPETAAQSLSAGALLEVYALSKSTDFRLRSIHLMTLPFGGRFPLGSRAQLVAEGAYAYARAELANGADGSASGLVDTRLSLEARLGGVSISASALLPTGDVVGTANEATVVGLLSTELLPFSVTQWGTGGGAAADIGYGGRIGEVTVRLSVGASQFRASSPLGFGAVYSPGTQLRTRAVVESAVGATGVLSVLVGYQHYMVDEYDGVNLFAPGARMGGAASYGFAAGPRKSILAYASVHRLQGGVSQLRLSGFTDLNNLLPGVGDQPARTLLGAGGELRLARGRYVFAPRADVRMLRRADGIGQGWLASAGGRAEIRPLDLMGRRWVVEPTLDVRVGRILVSQGVRSSVFGGQVGVTLRWDGS